MSDKLIVREGAKLSRRDMLKAAGITAAGFALGQLVNSPVALGAAEVGKQTIPMPYPTSGLSDTEIKQAMYWGAARYYHGGG